MYKKILLSFGVIGGFGLYAFHLKQETANHKVTQPSSITPTNSSGQETINPGNPTPAPTTTASGAKYKDGSYTGSVEDVFYGNLQVKATVSGGQITDVQFLQYPNDRETSIQINSQAMPFLKQEAIQAQSANVDVVSGATQSSEGFMRSLQNALDQAKA